MPGLAVPLTHSATPHYYYFSVCMCGFLENIAAPPQKLRFSLPIPFLKIISVYFSNVPLFAFSRVSVILWNLTTWRKNDVFHLQHTACFFVASSCLLGSSTRPSVRCCGKKPCHKHPVLSTSSAIFFFFLLVLSSSLHAFFHLFVHFCLYFFIHSFIHWFIHSLVCSLLCLIVRLWVPFFFFRPSASPVPPLSSFLSPFLAFVYRYPSAEGTAVTVPWQGFGPADAAHVRRGVQLTGC